MTQPTTEKATAEQLEVELSMHIGSLERFRHWSGRFVYTPGVRHLAERAGAYWLIDLIASWQLDPNVKREEFQVWTLDVRPGRTATAVATDGNDTVLASQDIAYTDFPLACISLWLTDGVLLLPGEY